MIIGERPTCTLIASSAETSRNPFFHMGCAYLQDRDELYLTSDLLEAASSSRLPTVLISKLTLTRHHNDQPAGGENYVDWVEWMKLRPPPEIPMPSGAIPYERGVLYCAQGTLVQRGGLFYMPLGKPPVPLVTSYFGTPFNSIQNVAADSDGNLWFTDSTEGAQRGIRPEPKLPNHVYCFHPKTNELRVVADGFMKPTGIATNGKVFYVSDTGTSRGGSFTGPTSAATIYAFDIEKRFQEPPFLTHKRVFAFALSGKPAALTLDGAGNVYAACGDGVEVWNSKGVLLGLLQVEGESNALS
ncbi:hypothetical protein F5Y16DRAFT_1231 [Xylariaceae sp. FL0255]|nr:hypothetical protein F5Y16DRAFT_1231 [Xylariaceae sp. FL0255]